MVRWTGEAWTGPHVPAALPVAASYEAQLALPSSVSLGPGGPPDRKEAGGDVAGESGARFAVIWALAPPLVPRDSGDFGPCPLLGRAIEFG